MRSLKYKMIDDKPFYSFEEFLLKKVHKREEVEYESNRQFWEQIWPQIKGYGYAAFIHGRLVAFKSFYDVMKFWRSFPWHIGFMKKDKGG